jgi:LPXTG-motif cell wall-anchored protein
MENKNLLYILLGVGAGIGVYYFLCKRKKQMAEQTND